jgi:hypothetical protein
MHEKLNALSAATNLYQGFWRTFGMPEKPFFAKWRVHSGKDFLALEALNRLCAKAH